MKEYPSYRCPIDKKDDEHKHKHRVANINSEYFIHMESFDFCTITLSFQVVETKTQRRIGLSSIHVGALGTINDKFWYIKHAEEIGEILAQMIAEAKYVKNLE